MFIVLTDSLSYLMSYDVIAASKPNRRWLNVIEYSSTISNFGLSGVATSYSCNTENRVDLILVI